MDSELSSADICRVCRSEGQPDRPLFHPCICTGSIKWIHQECLMQWMRYSRKEYCELCSYRFSFTPIYSPDMPRRLPIRDLLAGLLGSIGTAIKYWLHYTIVAIAWLGVVPIAACRIYRALFSGSFDAFLTLPFELFSMENLTPDIFQGCFVVTCTLFAFAGLVWLREQILHGGGPDWLQRDNNLNAAAQPDPPEAVPPFNNNIRDDIIEEDDENVNDDPGGPAQEDVQAAQAAEDGNEVVAAPGGAAGEDVIGGEDNNWIPMEWDRAAEEITWERLLGLDGSLMFLEHVFWVVSLNTLFIVVFAFAPYYVGLATLYLIGMHETASASHFEGLLTTLVGYCSVGMFLLFSHRFAGAIGFHRTKHMLGLCYVVVKVSMLSVLEIGILPLVCGWWLDICSLSMFDATLREREASFAAAPGTSIFLHWLIGMVYVYYFASFVLLLREILRPGVLWFLRNFNDPDFSPIQEMIHLPILEHVRKLIISAVIFGSVVMLMLWLPIKALRAALPSFLPYVVSLNSDAQVNELSLELLLLQVILPALLEQTHTRHWLKTLVRGWCKAVAWALDLHSYLLGNDQEDEQGHRQENGGEDPQPPNAPGIGNIPEPGAGLGAAHQALLMMEPPAGFQPYDRPTFFAARLVGLLLAVCVSLVACSLISLTVPVWLGRRVMALWLVGAPPPGGPQIAAKAVSTAAAVTTAAVSGVAGAASAAAATTTTTTEVKVHELYTAACGLYLCWLSTRAVTLLMSWLPQGRAAMTQRLRQWCILGLKTVVASTILLGVIPLLFGMLLELVVIVPLRVPIHQTPIMFVWQDWALGVLYTKIACALTMMGPDWFLRAAIERAYRDGIRDMQLSFIFTQLAAPVIISFGLALAVPYVIAHSIVPAFVTSLHTRNLIARRLYPFLLLVIVAGVVVVLQVRQFRKLYEHIKNDKYLVGQRLVNYDHRKTKSQTP